jgi:hypothetical protein
MPHLASILLAAAIALAGAAHADTLSRRGGEWRITVTGGLHPETNELCLTQTTMQQAMSHFVPGERCRRHDVSLHGNQVTFTVDCVAMVMQGTVTIASDTAYTADLTAAHGYGPGAQSMHVHTVATWIGDCKPGEKPVDY